MASVDVARVQQEPTDLTVIRPARRRRVTMAKHGPALLLVPSVVAVGIAVYGFIAYTGIVSTSKWQGLVKTLQAVQPWFANYRVLFESPRFQADLRNMVLFTVFFLAGTTIVGFLLALGVHKVLAMRGFLRGVFLFPYAISFIVSGVIWRWLFNPSTGVNLLFKITGLNSALEAAGMHPLKPGWLTDPSVVLSLNDALAKVFPGAAALHVKLGIPLALIPVAIAACWQFAGFAMAMFLSGLIGIPEELIEAARLDGASERQITRQIILPMLRPTMVSVLMILAFTSLKIFDLVFAMSGTGPGFATDMPGIFVYQEMFSGLQYSLAAAAAVVMFLLICCVVVPYLVLNARRNR